MIDVIETLNAAVNAKADAQTAAAVAAQVATDAATMTAHLADDVAAFAAKDALIEARDDTISTQIATIASLNGQISTLNGQIVGLNDQIAALQIETDVDEAQIASLTSQIATLNSQITGLNAQIAALQAQIVVLQQPVLLNPFNMLPGQTDRYLWASDVPDGPISSLTLKGRRTIPMLQGNTALQPTKANGEITFLPGQNVSCGNDKDAGLRSRWGVFIFWVDLSPTSGTTQLATVNGYSGGSSDRPYRQPCFEVDQATNKLKITTFDKNGAPSMTSPTAIDCSNGKYVMVEWYRRGDRLGWRIDGKPVGETACGPWMNNNSTSERCWFGFTPATNAQFKIKFWHTMDGEPSNKDLEFFEGIFAWLAGDAARLLPVDHRWKNAAPLLTDYRPEDKPVFWKYSGDPDIAAWKSAVDAIVFTHRGELTQATFLAGMKDAIVTDWDRADQFPAAPFGGPVNSPWFASDIFIDGQAAYYNPATSSFYPEAYAQDITNGGRLKLRMSRVGSVYRTGTIAMANAGGYGRHLKPGYYETEFSFTPLSSPLPPVFPGMIWFYSRGKWFLASYSPIETDGNEQTGKGAYYVEGSLRIHNPDVPTPGLAGVSLVDGGKKIYANNLIAGDSKGAQQPNPFPVTINLYDGQKHKMGFLKQRNGLCVFWMDGYEMARCPWHDSMSDPMVAIINHALDAAHGDRPLNDGEVVEMILEKFTYKMSDAEFDAVPAGFVSRPQLLNINGTLTVIPNTKEDHVEYRWYQNAVPLPLLMGKTAPASAGEWYVNVTNKAHAGTPDANTLRLTV